MTDYEIGKMLIDSNAHNGIDAYKKGRQDAIQEFRKKINKYLNESTDFADFVVTDTAIDCVLDEMKGGAENE